MLKINKVEIMGRERRIVVTALSKKELGYIFGVFCGDGYLYHDKKQRHYNVEFYLNSERDKDIEKYLIFLLKRLGLKPALFKDKRFKCMRIRCRCKDFFNLLKKFERKMLSEKEFVIGFISGLIDADGGISSKSYMRISNTNKKLIKCMINILKKLGVRYNIKTVRYEKKKWSDLYRIYISREKLIEIGSNSQKLRRALR